MGHTPMVRRRSMGAGALAVVVIFVIGPSMAAAQEPASAELRARLEGTWELVEWHHEGEVLRPPEIGGFWSNHDGIVLVTMHRSSGGSFQQSANYGTYQMNAETWSYQYDRRLSASGPSAQEASVTVGTGFGARSFQITRDGDKVLLDGPDDYREYDGGVFRFMPEGRVLRVWRKIE